MNHVVSYESLEESYRIMKMHSSDGQIDYESLSFYYIALNLTLTAVGNIYGCVEHAIAPGTLKYGDATDDITKLLKEMSHNLGEHRRQILVRLHEIGGLLEKAPIPGRKAKIFSIVTKGEITE